MKMNMKTNMKTTLTDTKPCSKRCNITLFEDNNMLPCYVGGVNELELHELYVGDLLELYKELLEKFRNGGFEL